MCQKISLAVKRIKYLHLKITNAIANMLCTEKNFCNERFET